MNANDKRRLACFRACCAAEVKRKREDSHFEDVVGQLLQPPNQGTFNPTPNIFPQLGNGQGIPQPPGSPSSDLFPNGNPFYTPGGPQYDLYVDGIPVNQHPDFRPPDPRYDVYVDGVPFQQHPDYRPDTRPTVDGVPFRPPRYTPSPAIEYPTYPRLPSPDGTNYSNPTVPPRLPSPDGTNYSAPSTLTPWLGMRFEYDENGRVVPNEQDFQEYYNHIMNRPVGSPVNVTDFPHPFVASGIEQLYEEDPSVSQRSAQAPNRYSPSVGPVQQLNPRSTDRSPSLNTQAGSCAPSTCCVPCCPPCPPPAPAPAPVQPSGPRDDIPLREQFPYAPRGPGSAFLGNQPPPVDLTPVDPSIDPTPPNDPPDPGPQPDPPAPPPAQCPSFHPDHTIPGHMSQADTVRAITAYTNSQGLRHDPDGITWIPRSHWVPWDGVTTINPCTSTTAQLMAFIFPPPGGVNTMRGLRERFYEVNPFVDNQNPTVAEIENWNIEVIRHFRRLLGFNQTTHPVSNDKCTYLKAAWAEERFRTNYWSASYPGTQNSATGPCTYPNSPNAHCGASFLPSPTDQAPYLCPANMPACTATTGAEGIANHNTNIPWANKMARVIGTYLSQDGIGGHTGPFVGRPLFGSAWHINPSNQSSLAVRTKWSGNLSPTCP